jgi:hypothetical protein
MLSLFKRFSKFATEALWNNLYARMYSEVLLDNSKILDYGAAVAAIMRKAQSRFEATEMIRQEIFRITRKDHTR